MGPITHSPVLPTRERRRVKACYGRRNLAVFPRRRARNREWKRTGQTPNGRAPPHTVLTAACPEFTADCINSHFSSASTASRDMGKGGSRPPVRSPAGGRGREGPFPKTSVSGRSVGGGSQKSSPSRSGPLSLSVDVCLARVWGLLRRKIKVTCIAASLSLPVHKE